MLITRSLNVDFKFWSFRKSLKAAISVDYLTKPCYRNIYNLVNNYKINTKYVIYTFKIVCIHFNSYSKYFNNCLLKAEIITNKKVLLIRILGVDTNG